MEAAAKKGLNSNQLKLIAIIAMTVDHLAWVIWPGYQTQWWDTIIPIALKSMPCVCWPLR